MNALRLYIWEGGRISDAYHDDGTLVVLASSPEEARSLVRAGRQDSDAWCAERDRLADEAGFGGDILGYWGTEAGAAYLATSQYAGDWWDGEETALDREPDRVLETDGPKWVAFNGGGYD